MLIRMLPGNRALRAPEDDRGAADLDDDLDLPLDPPEDDDPQDDPEELDDEDLDEADIDDQDDEPPPQRQSRGSARFQELDRRAKEAQERAERVERELAEIRGQMRPQTQQETPDQREARLAAMDPYDRLQYELRETRQQNERFQNEMRFQQADANDRIAFEAICARSPVAEKLKADVEKALADMRKGGTTAPRETVLKYLIGERALQNAGKATTRARTAADRNRSSQTARAPSGARGDAPSEGRRTTSGREKRLESLKI